MNVFDPEPLTYQVGDYKLVLKPLPFKKLQRALTVVTEAFKEIDAAAQKPAAELLGALPAVVASRFGELARILFDHEFVTDAWVEEHVTLPLARRILTDAMTQNQVSDFFGDLRGRRTPAPESPTPAPKPA